MTTQPVILYVEDDLRNRRVMELLLKGTMDLPHVYLFEDSRDFVSRATALDPKPTIVLLDIHVPPHNGFEMLTMLRDLPQYKGIPIVALTASVMNEEVEKLRTAGFDSIIAKPIDIDTFPSLLDRVLTGERIWNVLEAR
ncbi:MAG: response regulator [Anaerolineae bacterium]|nr:response regulator [Anaerolineae bacterium]